MRILGKVGRGNFNPRSQAGSDSAFLRSRGTATVFQSTLPSRERLSFVSPF